MNGLAEITHKPPIVATFDTQTLCTSVATVQTVYKQHARTYVEQPAVAAIRKAFIESVHQAKTPKACIVAPFGYGKTATAIGIWDACQQSGLLTIPPISCSSFAELAQGVYTWSVFALPDYRQQLDEGYDTFLALSADAMARRDEQQFHIPFEQARAAIRDKIERGYLDFEDISVNLVAFLEQATRLACRAGHQGLVVIVDEIQQLIGNANKGVLVALRQLIWGLRTRQLPLGMLFTMDPDTERTLADRAGDILHRIKDDGLYLDMCHIYDREFPARLWKQYAAAFNLVSEARTVIDNPALEALGQLCERDDLSNGPRTVISVLQRAATRYMIGAGSGYTPIDLINDLLNGTIRFDGDRGVIPALVGELLNYPYFQRSPELAQALRLLAAFPRGCPEQVAQRYRLEHAWRALNDDLRGEIVTELDEGLALIELQRVGRPAHRLNVLLRRYWMQITDQQLLAETAPKVFSTIVLPLIFPPKIHDLSGWAGVDDIQLDAEGRYTGIIEGTSSSRYPLRRVKVAVIADTAPAPPLHPRDDVDLLLIFRLDVVAEGMSRLSIVADEHIEFHLALRSISQIGLCGGLAWIAHYLSPQPISAAVVLSLLNYLRKERIDDASERDQVRIADTVARLQEWLLAELFPQELFSRTDFAVIAAGLSGFKEFLYLFFNRRWGDYPSVATHQHWATLLNDYESALTHVAPEVRVGGAPHIGSKSEIAHLFGQKRHAGFESRVSQYGSLLKIEAWDGNQASVRFEPHPAEVALANQIRAVGALTQDDAYRYVRVQGFSTAEANAILRLMLARGLVQQDNTMLMSPDCPTAIEVRTRAESLRARCEGLPDVPAQVTATLQTAFTALEQATDLGRIGWELDRAEEQIHRHEEQARVAAETRRAAARKRLLTALSHLKLAPPAQTLGELEKHIIAVYGILEEEQQKLLPEVEKMVAPSNHCDPDAAESILNRIEKWENNAAWYRQWNTIAPRITTLHAALRRLTGGDQRLDALLPTITELVRDAREVLAQTGMRALSEIQRLESVLARCEQEFKSLADARHAAYIHLAAALCQEVQTLLELATPLTPPPYCPEDDEGSFQRLCHMIATIVSRTLSLKELFFVTERATRQEKAAYAKVRTRIQAVAQQSADSDWLIGGIPPQIRPKAVKGIQNLLAQIDQAAHEIAPARRHLIQSLAGAPAGPVDLTSVLERTNGQVDQQAVVEELIRLHRANRLRLTIDYSDTA